jgi:transcriptional regulator with XRE-family HTH domain
MSQTAFGAIGRVTKKTQALYENGQRSPDAQYLASIATAGVDVLYILTGQRASDLSEGDRILLNNFHAAPAQVQAGVKTTLSAFTDPESQVKRRKGG